MDNKWNQLADDQTIEKTASSLKENGFNAIVVDNGEEAKAKVLELIPEGSEIMTMTSVTLDTIGLTEELNKEGKFKPVRDKLYEMNKDTHAQEMNKLGAAPEYAISSIHALTEEGHVLIASNTGSQLPAQAYSALHVILVVGAQKIVKNTHDGIDRIYEYVLPLESERARKAYGVDGSFVSKILIINREIQPGRITVVLVKEKLGF